MKINLNIYYKNDTGGLLMEDQENLKYSHFINLLSELILKHHERSNEKENNECPS
ncbi:hypothetical protein [Halobacillus trueperi]|uniref:hypothetical protein n=1 Tax=Halobacillus trueperi TaxID=156205 RepID=UPI00373547E0